MSGDITFVFVAREAESVKVKCKLLQGRKEIVTCDFDSVQTSAQKHANTKLAREKILTDLMN